MNKKRIYAKTSTKLPRRYCFGPDELPVSDWKVAMVLGTGVCVWLGAFVWLLHR